jgi:hypothetical protein
LRQARTNNLTTSEGIKGSGSTQGWKMTGSTQKTNQNVQHIYDEDDHNNDPNNLKERLNSWDERCEPQDQA